MHTNSNTPQKSKSKGCLKSSHTLDKINNTDIPV